MICAIISLTINLMIWAMGLMFQLALWIFQALVAVALEVSTIVVEFILSILGACFGTISINNSKAARKSVATSRPVENRPEKLSRRERKAIEKNVRSEIQKARDDIEYDMLMMMEVFMDD